MTEDEFWKLIERVHDMSPDDMKTKCDLLEKELFALSPEEILSFGRHMSAFYYQADRWDIWGAAYVICGGCGDDSFMDFRHNLISMGRTPFHAALNDADSLADFEIDPEWARFEGYQYVAGKAWLRLGYTAPEEIDSPRAHQQTVGEEFDPEEMTPRFPRLVAKYNYVDTPPEVLKAKRERAANKERMSELIKRILLNGIIPRCGLFPPPRITRQVLAAGAVPTGSNLSFTWEPFSLNEEHYWIAIKKLESISTADLESRPDLVGQKLALDTGCGSASDYVAWIQSLNQRRLL